MTYIALHRYIQPRKTNLQGSHADFTTLRDKALAGLKLKMGSDPIPENYRERLKRELDMVANMRLEKYFLLVSDIVSDLHNMGILVGVWHGNSTGSFMCYCLGITQIHSLSHELFFEGFLTPVTRFMPPICLDFSHIHRKEVFEYLRSKYGNENISSVCSDIRDRKTPMSHSTTIPSCGVYFLNMTGARSLSTKDEKCSPLHNDASVLDEGGYIGIGLNGLEILSVIEKIQAQIKIQENLNVDVNKVPCDDAKAYAPILPWDNRIQSLIQLLILADLQLPAHAEDAEQAILGSMLLEPEAIKTAHEMLDATNFYHRANRIIFSSIGELFNHQGAVNLATLRGILKSSGRLFEVGGEIYLAELIGKASTAGDVQHYAEIVRQKARLRDLMSSATAIAENNYETKKELAKLMNHAEEKLFAIAQKSALVDFVSADGIAEDFTYNLEREMKIRNVITGVPTGFHRFDEMTGGLQRTDLIILASRPSLGKTTMALNIAYNAAVEKEIPTAVFSLEMSSDSIFRRMLRSGAMPHFDTIMRTPQPQRERWAALTSEIGRIRHAPLWIDDNADLTVADIRMRAKRLASELKRKNKELGLIIIDYLQLIQGSGKKNETRQQEVSEISMRLKALANTLNLPILLLSQIARVDRVDKRPLISDLRDFRSIEPVADVVALIHREGYYHHEDPAIKNLATLILAKQRNGPTGDITLNFLGQFVKFTNPPPSDTKASPRATTSPS